MKITIKHEIQGRIRFSLSEKRLSSTQADMLLYYLKSIKQVTGAKVYQRSADAAVTFTGDRGTLLEEIVKFSFKNKEIQALVPEHTGRELTSCYQEKLIMMAVKRYVYKWFLPSPLRHIRMAWNAFMFIKKGLHCLLKGSLEVPVLDAVAISVSLLRKDYKTAESVMFLLQTGEVMEEWTHKKSVADLASSMALNVEKAWLVNGESEVLVPVKEIQENDIIRVQTGHMIPLDGIVHFGEAMVNQASMTGESILVKKAEGAYVYAGTVLEEGEILIRIKSSSGSTRYEKIVNMIEDSEKLKSAVESRAEHLADRLVPYTFLGTGLVYLLTRNITKALSVLMVDFSCALKLAMPVTVLSAMRECQNHCVTVKGGKFLEAVAQADTIVFDKTGTLTKAQPTVAKIITFAGRERDEMLRLAACLEEHYPHSIANAVVKQAEKEGLKHEERHTKIEYVVAHGISSKIDGEKVIIGSRHFVFEDEQCVIPQGEEEKFDSISDEYSHLYLAISGVLSAVICIEDPLREEAAEVIEKLRDCGFKKIVMMTGDSERTARAVAKKAGVDEYYAEVLPEDKASFVEEEKRQGRRVVMIGDGINDSPALSAADAGIAISEGAQIAKEVSDIMISDSNLHQLVVLKKISNGVFQRIQGNYRFIIGFNLSLIILGVVGVIAPSTSAFLHNTSTLGIGLKSMTNILKDE